MMASPILVEQGVCIFYFLIFLHVLCLCATRSVMTALPLISTTYWLEAHYAATISAFSRRNLSATFGFPVLSP